MMLNFYTIFHLNLMYSSIDEDQRKEVIDKCYYPLLELARKGFPFSVELTGLTLEMIKEESPEWVEEFKALLVGRKVELIGSGYSQIIGPLIPNDINIKNQAIGLNTYEKILGIKPDVVLVNEMAYSAGMLDIYKEAGYKAFIMEWNNPYRYHKEWDKEWLYSPHNATGIKHVLPVVWADSIAFQKFQRYAHGEIPLREYIEYIYSHHTDENRFFPLYANDTEIFNFRPRRYETENIIRHNEWNRVEKLLCVLRNKGDFNFVLISGVLEHLQDNILRLESPEQPIPVKKQEKYNINRWALTGRADLDINTKLFKLMESFKVNNPSEDDWKRLLYFASSDFRTHITQQRWKDYLCKLDGFMDRWGANSTSSDVMFDNKMGSTGGTFKISKNRFYVRIESDGLACVFSKTKGLAANRVIFKKKDQYPLIGTLPHGYYDDISWGADFFSFHSVIERPGEHKYTNLSEVEYSLKEGDERVFVEISHNDRGMIFFREYIIANNEIRVFLRMEMPDRALATVHPFNLTFIPSSFDRESIFFATHNGGNELEYFYIGDKEVNHSQSLSSLVSAKSGLGATEGVVIIGDKYKSLVVEHNRRLSALIPSISFSPIGDSFFLRLQYSAQEMDDTFLPNADPQVIECEFTIH